MNSFKLYTERLLHVLVNYYSKVRQKKKQLKKEGKPQDVPEDIPEKVRFCVFGSFQSYDCSAAVRLNYDLYVRRLFDVFQYKHAVYVQTCKLFADLERMRQEQETREQHEK